MSNSNKPIPLNVLGGFSQKTPYTRMSGRVTAASVTGRFTDLVKKPPCTVSFTAKRLR